MKLKRRDTFFTLMVVFGLGVVMLGLGRLDAAAVVPAALAYCLLVGVGLAWHLYRARQEEEQEQLRQVQALVTLTSMITLRAPLPPLTGWAASPELACHLVGLVRERRPRRVVELGSGVSSVVVAYALEQTGGRLTALDHDGAYAAETNQQLALHGLAETARVLHAPLRPQEWEGRSWQWYDVSRIEPDEAPIDLLIVDGPPHMTQKNARYPALPALLPQLSPEAVVVLDDAYRGEEQEILQQWTTRFDGFDLELKPSPKGTAVLRRRAG